MASLSPKRIQRDFGRGDNAADGYERALALEDLTKYLFRRLPGVRFSAQDVVVAGGSEEIDLVFWNDGLREGLPFLPNILLFECKNWHDPVVSSAVSFFIQKVTSRHLEYGFLIAANGITGDQNEITAAHAQIETAFLQNKVKTLVLTRAEIEQLTSTEALIRLIQDKILRLTLRKPQFML
jgi:Restriction endonuclease